MREINFLKNIWLLTLISAFFGPYLAWSGMPNLFGYRILLITHTFLFGLVFLIGAGGKQGFKWGFRVKPYFIFFLLWLTWGLISLLWAPNTILGIKHLVYLGSGCLIVFFTVFYSRTLEDLKTLLMINVFVLIFEIGLGLWELYSGFHLMGSFPRYYLRHNILPVIGTFGHPNNFATYLSMYLPLLYMWGKYHENKIMTCIYFILLILGIHLIISTDSRANMLAVILGIIFVLIFIIINNWDLFFRSLIKTIIILTIILGLGTFSYTNQFFDLTNNHIVQQITSVFTHWEEGSSINVRKTLILKGLAMLKESYGFGVGPGNSQFLMEQYKNETFGNVKMHNWWVEVLVDYGVLVWVLLLFFLAKMIRDLMRVYRSSEQQKLKMWAEGLMISLIMFFIGVLSNGSMMSSPHMWILFGLVLSVINVHNLNVEGR